MKPLSPLVVLALALAGCVAQPAPEPAQPEAAAAPPPEAPEAALEDITFTDQQVTLLALPLVGGSATVAYEVPEGASWLGATLRWPTRGAQLRLAATDPAGAEAGELRPSEPGPGTTRFDWYQASPAAGEWTFTVTGERALQEQALLQLHHLAQPASPMHVAQRSEVGRGFVEVNMEMKAGDTIRYVWSAAQPVHFDIHTHVDEETIYLVDETSDGMDATFTAETDGGYSLLWALDAAPQDRLLAQPVEVTYRIDGAFALYSGVG